MAGEMLLRREFVKKGMLWGGYALGALAIAFPVFSFIGFRKITEKKIFFPPIHSMAPPVSRKVST